MSPALKLKIKNLPQSPGVYLFKDRHQNIIYVGKAKNLKNRVRTYFQNQENFKTALLCKEISDFDIILSHTEVEALLLERTLIRHHRPRFNINLKDDKEYPYVRVNLKEKWPTPRKVRRIKDDGAVYVGPFGNAGILNYTLRTIFRAFPMVRCSPAEFQRATRPCNYYHMKMCLAPCSLNVSRSDYLEMTKDLIKILRGDGEFLIQDLTKKMHLASLEENYEKAADFRDQISAVKKLSASQVAVVAEVENADIINFYHSKDICTLAVLIVRNFHLIANESFTVAAPIQDQDEILKGFILQYYGNRSAPKNIVLPHMPKDWQNLRLAVGNQESLWRKPSGTEEIDLINLAFKNARHHYENQSLHRENYSAELSAIQSHLNLSHLPNRIECIDISNLGDKNIVAACVCFMGGKKSKEHYRRYKLSQNYQDDFGAIFEVVSRRLKRGIEEENLPDLLIIDGGKGQLAAAEKAAQAYPSLPMTIVGLAKSRTVKNSQHHTSIQRTHERVFLSNRLHPILLIAGTPTFRVFTQIRDEAHRFAISYHRSTRQKSFKSSVLESVPGVGPILKKRLLTHFNDIDGVRAASEGELQKIKGVSSPLAKLIVEMLRKEQT